MAEETIAGRYRLVALLGRGGMSEVWAADDLELGRRVALKLLAPDADRARFDREARAAASLAHPNITQLYDYGEAEGRPYMVLEYLPGGSLEDRLEEGTPLPDADAAHIASEIAAGLAHAHARGLVHRDLKPANVLFDSEGRAKIADFGIARLGQGGTLTEAGTVLGTAAYISPEQAGGQPASPASDVYSFGVLLFRMLTGRLPFEAEQPMDLVALHRNEPPPPLERFRSHAPPALAALAQASLAKDPAERPPDGRALTAELGAPAPPTASASTSAVVAQDTAAVTRVLRPQRGGGGRRSRRRLAIALGTLALLAAGGVAAVAVTRSDGTSSGANVSTALPAIPTRSLPKLTTTAAAPVAPAPTTTAAATTRAKTPTRPPATTAPPPTTVAPPPTTAPPPATTEPPPTTAPATTDTTATATP
ncbi:MAG: serine/threonine protein kinase [Actinobacteria bacterium]|nr:MAG: serine/threonine protein kinase [Actinomycetota bacterium]